MTNISEEYHNYLKSEKWQNIRQEVLQRDNYHCRLCNSTNFLQIHHISGKHRFKEETALYSLMTLCDSCHEKIHRYYEQCDTLKKGEFKK